jgi:hypothetical protein
MQAFHPHTIGKTIFHRKVFPPGKLEEGGEFVLQCLAIMPWLFPKERLGTISQL